MLDTEIIKGKTMLQIFNIGDKVNKLSDKKRMTVVNVADGNVTCAWLDNDGIELRDTFTADTLEKYAPKFSTMKVTGL